MSTQFILTGTSNICIDIDKAPNGSVCPGTHCNFGKKPFVIAGGKVNINAMPDSCSTHTPILQKVFTDPTYNADDFTPFAEFPDACPYAGLSFVSYTFDNGDYGNWTGNYGTLMEVESDGAVRVTSRRLRDRGPHLDITHLGPDLCLVPNQDYLFTAR